MRKLFILILLPFFVACSSDDNELDNIKPELPKEEAQDHTSFLFALSENKEFKYTNCTAAYFNEEGYCLKLADVGEVSFQQTSKEIKVNIDTLTRIYLFVNVENKEGDVLNLLRVDNPYILKKDYKNVYNLVGAKLINVTESLKEYPH